ncbi:MAG: hypothetical protein ACK5PB_19530 [Pirellula sp.]|jgi:hypothetical protein
MSLVEQRDFILLAMGSPFGLGYDYWRHVSEQIKVRLDVMVGLYPNVSEDSNSFWPALCKELARQRITRLLIVSTDTRSSVLQSIREALAWSANAGAVGILNRNLGIHFSKPFDEVDWAEVLAGSPLAYTHSWRLTTELVPASPLSDYTRQRRTISGIVWEMRRLGLDADYIILDKRSPPIFPEGPCVKLRWCGRNMDFEDASAQSICSKIEIADLQDNEPAKFANIVPSESWVHVIVKKYLESIRYGTPRNEEMSKVSLSHYEDKESWDNGYKELIFRMEELLPSEYRGKTDTVSPNSMGTARIEVGADGKVPWDKIWTSFCDLALAGGPPHRGKLLEAVASEECASNPELYESVVAEIERGIQLVTGLTTVRSESLGWVGVECHDQQMAAWLMRAIIVENVMVRRQSNILYVPAGPSFQIRKEIKNVITSVAKTVHYWNEHRR